MTRSEREELKPRVLKLVSSMLEALTSMDLNRARPATRSGVVTCSTWRVLSFSIVIGTWPMLSSTREADTTTWSSMLLVRSFTTRALLGALSGRDWALYPTNDTNSTTGPFAKSAFKLNIPCSSVAPPVPVP